MMYSKHNDHSLVLNKSSNTMIIWLKVMFELSLDLHGQCYSGSDNHPWVIENKGYFCLFVCKRGDAISWQTPDKVV